MRNDTHTQGGPQSNNAKNVEKHNAVKLTAEFTDSTLNFILFIGFGIEFTNVPKTIFHSNVGASES